MLQKRRQDNVGWNREGKLFQLVVRLAVRSLVFLLLLIILFHIYLNTINYSKADVVLYIQ